MPIHDVGVDERGEYYFVMKYVDGKTLETIIEKLSAGDPRYRATYPFERRMEINGILEALNYAHASGVVDRDIKPANVMVGHYGEVMVMDWGVARQLRVDGPDPRTIFPQQKGKEAVEVHTKRPHAELFRTQAGALIGTPAYMSPEQARGESIDERSDIYSACVLLHELLSLRHPHEDKQSLGDMLEAVKNEPIPTLITWKHPHQPVVPADLAWYVHKGLAKDPAARYQTVGGDDRPTATAQGGLDSGPVSNHVHPARGEHPAQLRHPPSNGDHLRDGRRDPCDPDRWPRVDGAALARGVVTPQRSRLPEALLQDRLEFGVRQDDGVRLHAAAAQSAMTAASAVAVIP